jgi:HPt (histidine-containing phosphotransfer) domain-containing protein
MTDPLASLRRRFLARVVEDLAALDAGAEPGPLVHRLAGTAGTLGFAELSLLASIVDDQLAEGPADPADWETLVAAMRAATQAPG